MIETVLSKCSADWKEQNTELNTKMDLMLQLQQQRLQLERDCLEFEREMGGLGKSKNKSANAASKVPKTRKRKKGNLNFTIDVLTQHFTLCICPTQSPSMS